MARIKREEDYSVKRNEILDVAQQLIYSKGYEQMSIQDIVNALQISKGAFYHYFDSKPDLLNALIDRTTQEGLKVLEPILCDQHLSALDKLQQYFESMARWKSAQKEYLMGILRIWYADENAIVRQKTSALGIEKIAPLIGDVIRQGVHEGVFSIKNPEQSGQVVLSLLVSLGEYMARMVLSLNQAGADRQNGIREMSSTAAAYNTALERVLGAPEGKIDLFDATSMRIWVIPEGELVEERHK